MLVTLDSSVIIAALREQEKKHKECQELLEKIREAKYIAVQPYTVLVEVVAAIRRRTNSQFLAKQVKELLLKIDTMNFLELESTRADASVDIATHTGLRGMDAIIVQIANEFGAVLFTLDEEIMDKAKSIINIMKVEDFQNL